MTITPVMIYWITRLDDLKGFTQSLGWATAIIALLATIFLMAIEDVHGGPFLGHIKFSVPCVFLGVFFLYISCMIPTKKDMAAIIIIPPLANGILSNKDMMAIPGDLAGLTRDWISDLRPAEAKKLDTKK
jgi:hypothetical protein